MSVARRSADTRIADESRKGHRSMLSRRRERPDPRFAASPAGWMLWMMTSCFLLAGNAVAQVHLTSLEGPVTQGGKLLSLHAAVDENRQIEVPAGARCSLLLADQTLAQVCGVALASFSETESGDTVELGVGELKVIAPDDAPVSVHTPSVSIVLRGAGAHISVAPGGSETVVSALDGKLSVTRRDELDATLVNAGQQLIVERGQALGDLRDVSRESLARNSLCLNDDTRYRAALRAERAILIGGAPAVSAGADAAIAHPASDLEQIVSADVPVDGLPLEDSATPSALVTELGKRGMDEEICDPINCNPVYQLPAPPPCGVPPVRPCS